MVLQIDGEQEIPEKSTGEGNTKFHLFSLYLNYKLTNAELRLKLSS